MQIRIDSRITNLKVGHLIGIEVISVDVIWSINAHFLKKLALMYLCLL